MRYHGAMCRSLASPLAATVFLLALVIFAIEATATDDPLPSWNAGASKDAVTAFVDAVTMEGGEGFVPPPERIAVFDNDGTLWIEQPVYNQVAFAFDRIKTMAPDHPEWADDPAVQAVLADDMGALAGMGHHGIERILMITHSGMTTDAFAETVTAWLEQARHPRFDRPYTALVYQPMVELLSYLRDNGFKTYIVSGGGIEFMRPWTEGVYGIPPENVVGSSIETQYEVRDGTPVLVRVPEVDFVNDKAGKPVGINKFIGRRPIAAFGNSDGDLEMLQWVTAGPGKRFGMIVRHDDADREYAYDRESAIGRLDKALDAAPGAGWTVVSMKADWKDIFPAE